jgi:hypothetical protein
LSWVIIVFTIKAEDIIEHFLGYDGRAVGVKGYGFHIAIESMLVITLFAIGIAL